MNHSRSCRRSRRSKRPASRHGGTQRLRIEQLESRLALDGATLANDVFDVGQNSPSANLDVLANDVFTADYTGARRVTSISYGSEGGSIEVAADGQSLRYAPPADFFGTETFVYVVDHEHTAQVQVHVRAPLAFDSLTIPPDGIQRRLEVMANDPFWPDYAGPREITSVSVTSAGGEVEIGADRRSILYTPPEGAYGKDEFVYIVDGVYPARVTISIPETLKPDQVELVQHTPGTFDLLANDPFWPGYAGQRRITHVLDADEGATVTISGDGRSVTYIPAPNAAGGDTFRYVVDGSYETSVNVAIHRPVRDDWLETDENSTNQSFNVTANDRYRDLGNFERDVIDRVTSVTQPESGGVVSISADGQSVIYTPPAGFSGTDSFTYIADGVHEAQVRVHVNRPVRDDYISHGVYQDTANAILDVLANDFLGNGYTGPRLITSVGPTEHGGVVSIGGGGQWLVYTPAAGYTGQDAFSYTVDGLLEARVTLSVASLAVGDYFNFCPDPAHGAYTLDVLNNDHFLRGYQGPGVITAISEFSGSGEVSIVDGRRLVFVPGPTGAASFKYTVDGKYEATVSVSLRNRLQSDSAVVDQNSTAQSLNVLGNDFSPIDVYHCGPYTGPRQITGVSASRQGGVVTIGDDGQSVRYQPPVDFHGEDSFTYTVDGIMQTTVAVHVIRRVRDDQFRVEGDAVGEALPVLVNDLFGADYVGARRITAVSAATAGGTVSISADGRSVQYTPAAGFSGVDTFVYTVDGRLKAEVQVRVDSTGQDQFPTFGTLEDYQQFLIDDALVRYEHLFGQPSWYSVLDGGFTSLNGAGAPPREHSDTNVQVAGVDEGDIVEFDADYVYMLTDDELVIVDAWPAEEMSVASRVDIEGRPVAEFLHGDRLTVISVMGGEFLPWDGLDFGAGLAGPMVDSALGPWYRMSPSTTLVTVIDVTQRTAPTIVQTTSMEGRYVDSRAIGDFVYLLISNDNAVAPPPRVITEGEPDPNDPIFTMGVYETREEYLARVTANPGEMVDGALPNYTAYGPDGEVVRTGLLNEAEGIYRPLVADARDLISVVSFNVESDEPGLASTSAVYTSGASAVYASLENFYVFDRDHSTEDGSLTRIMKFDWDAATGGVEFAATTTVPGSILNQFSADEHDGYLRLATTIANSGAGNWSGRAENTLFVLADDGGVFEFVGSLQNLALNETMRSIRYMGDRAFLTTYRNVDPLFGVDLSDPTNPRAVGHLTLPGFSSYMQLIDETHLLTVGQNTPSGVGGPTQVALFDVSDLAQPRRIDEYTFERFSTSEAQIDHHAFGYFAAHGLLALPTSRSYVERVDEDGDGYRETRKWVREDALSVLTIDVGAGTLAVELAGEIPHDTAVRRSGYIGDYLYSLSGDSVKVAHVSDPGVVIGEAIVADPSDDPPPVPFDPFDLRTYFSVESTLVPPPRFPAKARNGALWEAVEAAQSHLAAHLQGEAGASLMVSAEAAAPEAGGGFQVVLRAGDKQYLYFARGEHSVLLASEEFAFASDSAGGVWHAIGAAMPTMPGDHDFDGHVDEADLAVWRIAYGTGASADADADGDSDGADFLRFLMIVV